VNTVRIPADATICILAAHLTSQYKSQTFARIGTLILVPTFHSHDHTRLQRRSYEAELGDEQEAFVGTISEFFLVLLIQYGVVLISRRDQDPPPDYSQAASQNNLPSVRAPQLLPDVKPSNFVSLSRPNSSISGKWIIEPSLLIPPSLLPSLSSNETEETRRNLSLFSQNGNVDAEIFIMPSNNEASHGVLKRSRILIEVASKNGSVKTKVVSHNSFRPLNLLFFFHYHY
jgi:hypothetical protein